MFGDGSVVILSTPGHTPGHQSLLVHLPKTGYVVLTGDLAHFKDNWDNDRVPSMNTSADQTHASHAKVVKVLADKKAQLWINHDKPTSAGAKAFAAVLRLSATRSVARRARRTRRAPSRRWPRSGQVQGSHRAACARS